MTEESSLLARNAHIPTDEIERDIAETEYEIETMTREMEGYRLMTHDRMAQFRADARCSGIANRRAFVEKLKRLLNLRHNDPKDD